MEILNKFLPYFRNVFVVSASAYLLWMMFLDANNIPNQLKTRIKLARLEGEKEYYLEKIKEVQQDREELMSDSDLLEKFAREKYLMRKPNEDVYIIVSEDE